MAKVIVEIDLDYVSKAELFPAGDNLEWYPIPSRPNVISIDATDLEIDPTDDSYFLFKVIEVKE